MGEKRERQRDRQTDSEKELIHRKNREADMEIERKR